MSCGGVYASFGAFFFIYGDIVCQRQCPKLVQRLPEAIFGGIGSVYFEMKKYKDYNQH